MSSPTSPPDRPRFRLPGIAWRSLAFILAALIIYLCVTRWSSWQGEAREQSTDDAYLQSDLTPLSAQVAGYVAAVPVQDYQPVQAGQLIVQIDDAPYQAALAQAQASVAEAQAQIAQVAGQQPLLAADLQAAQAQVAASRAKLAQAGRDAARQARLLRGGSASQAQLEQTQTSQAELLAQLRQMQAQAQAVQQQINLLAAQAAQARAALQAAQAARRVAAINLGYTKITAPHAGVIATRQVLPGQFIAAGTQVTVLTALPLVWVTANYKETQLTHVVVGDQAVLRVDAFPGQVFHGHVVAISPASGAEFALLPPDNATGNFTKIVQRVAVKIAIDDPGRFAGRLLPGMSAVPTIDTGRPGGRP